MYKAHLRMYVRTCIHRRVCTYGMYVLAFVSIKVHMQEWWKMRAGSTCSLKGNTAPLSSDRDNVKRWVLKCSVYLNSTKYLCTYSSFDNKTLSGSFYVCWTIG